MAMNKNHDTERLLANLRKHLDFKTERETVSGIMGDFFWFLTEGIDKLPKDLDSAGYKLCKDCPCPSDGSSICANIFPEVIKKAERTKKCERFKCANKKAGFCIPIFQGDRVYGYLIACQINGELDNKMLELISAFTQTVLHEVQKEVELKRLYETIRPRAIALSTVHTLHRLISSTLNLNELLPRVARLSLQIMRANRCSIKLVDSKKKNLLPKATVDLRAKKTKLKKVQIGRWAPGKAVKYGRPIRGKDYLATPLIDEDVIGVITVYDKIDKNPFTDFDEEIMKTLSEQAVIAIKNAQLYKEQERLTIGSIKSIAAILETKAPGTYLPRGSFLKLVHLIGHELRMSETELKSLQYATLLHDAGQITLPDKVTKKKGLLTGKEYNLIKEHPKKAAIILKPLKALKDVVPIILHHHENFDGSGYPSGLKGNEIPLGARIMGVVGSFEAMITEKPYRKPLGFKEAVLEIRKNAGKQFDPLVCNAFLNVIRRKDVRKMIKKEIYGSKKNRKKIKSS